MAEKKETSEVKKAAQKEAMEKVVAKLKKVLELDPVLTDRMWDKLQEKATWVYYGLLILTFIYAMATWVTMGFAAFLIQAVVYFALVRLFCEKLVQK